MLQPVSVIDYSVGRAAWRFVGLSTSTHSWLTSVMVVCNKQAIRSMNCFLFEVKILIAMV